MIRVALVGIAHETNTFSPVITDRAKFEADGIFSSRDILDQHASAKTTLSGFLSVHDPGSIEVVPLAWAWANPSGTVTSEAFESLCRDQLALLEEQGPWDAVFMAQHGAGVSESHPDLDAEFARRIRAIVGWSVPIGVALDLHSNVSPGLIDATTIAVGYKTNPHVDAFETARECALLTLDVAGGAPAPTMAFRQVPAAISILRQATAEEPMASIVSLVRDIAARPGILSASVFEGYPYADVTDMGMSCLVVGDEEVAHTACGELAQLVWDLRHDFVGVATPPAEAVRRRSDAGPIILLDVGDNVGGGGDGRSTTLLAHMRDQQVGRTATIIHDPDAVGMCVAAGEGATVTVEVGRPALELQGTVGLITDGHYEDPNPTHGGFRFFDTGPTCVLHLDNEDVVILTTKLVLPISVQQFVASGIDPASRRMIVAKGVVSPRPAFAGIAGGMVLVDSPGVTTSNLEQLPYKNRRRPMFPFETVDEESI
jgi:microcystin degradation protein MlrC